MEEEKNKKSKAKQERENEINNKIEKTLKQRNKRIAKVIENLKEIASENLAKAEFPNEIWKTENGVKISKRRIEKSKKSKNEKEKYEKEKNIAELLAKSGHSVWLLPEEKVNAKNPDAIIDGLIYDFKEVKFSKLEIRFSEALEQADNVVLRLLGNDFDIQRVFGKLRKHIKNRQGKLILILNRKISIHYFYEIK